MKRTSSLKQAAKAKVVRDDWDDDDDEEEQIEGEREKERDANGGDTKVTAMASRVGKDGPGPVPSGRREMAAEERKGEEDSSKIWEEA